MRRLAWAAALAAAFRALLGRERAARPAPARPADETVPAAHIVREPDTHEFERITQADIDRLLGGAS